MRTISVAGTGTSGTAGRVSATEVSRAGALARVTGFLRVPAGPDPCIVRAAGALSAGADHVGARVPGVVEQRRAEPTGGRGAGL
jgi:hypothetical protein